MFASVHSYECALSSSRTGVRSTHGFFCNCSDSKNRARGANLGPFVPLARGPPRLFALNDPLLDLGEVELDGGGSAEDRDLHLELLLVGLHLFDRPGEIGESTVDDADLV